MVGRWREQGVVVRTLARRPRLAFTVGLVLVAVPALLFEAPIAEAKPRAAPPSTKVLRVSEMPPGWRVDNSSSSGGLGGSRCLAGLTTTTHHTSQAAAEFEYGAGLPFVGETLGSGKQEVSDFAKVSARLAGCKTLKLTANGATYPGTIGALSFPTVGTKSSAYLITFAIKGVTAGIDLIVFTTASYVGTLTYGDVGTPDVSQVEAFASLALAKLRGSPLPSLPTPTTAPHSVA